MPRIPLTVIFICAQILFLTSCRDEVIKNDCSKQFKFNSDVDGPVLVDYSQIDTIKYLRQTDSTSDTLIFALQSFSDEPLIFQGLSPETWFNSDETSEHYKIEYQEIKNNEPFVFEIRGRLDSDKETSPFGSTIVFAVNSIYFVSDLGLNSIGDFDVASYTSTLITNTGLFTNCWSGFADLISFEFTRTSIKGEQDELNHEATYNSNYGLIKIDFDEGNEVWELIP